MLFRRKIPKPQEALRSAVCGAEGAGRGPGELSRSRAASTGAGASVSQHQGQGQVHGRHSTLTEQILTAKSLRLLKGQRCGQEH